MSGVPGILLHRGGVLAAAVVALTGLLAAVLLPFGAWHPAVAIPLVLLGAVALVPWVRRVPAPAVPWWAAAACVAIAAGHGVWAALTRAEHVVLRRDAGSYALYTQWIATRHGLPVDADLAAFGGSEALADPAFRLASPAFFQVLDGAPGAAGTTAELAPQFLPGAPAWFSFGWWAAGWDGVFVLPAIASALALLALAGLAARLVGPVWAVPATATLALCQPVLHAARSTYSEPLALLLVAAAAALLVDATARSGDPRLARGLGLAAGLLAGLAGLVRVDALREVVLLLPVAAVLALRRHPAGGPLAAGALGGLAVAAATALVLSRPYRGEIAGSLLPLAAGGLLLGLASAVAVLRARRRPAPDGPRREPGARDRLAVATGVAVLAVGAVLASRPLWLVTRQDPADPGARVVAGLQLRQGLPVDGGRTYAEHSLDWVAWYLGPVTVVAAWLAFAVLAARAVAWWRSGAATGPPVWLGPAAVALAATVLTLVRPGITPDHPWADRRLVPVVLPAVVLVACAAAASATRAVRGWEAGRDAQARVGPGVAVVSLATVALLLPAWQGTAGVVTDGTERGEPAAVARVCAALGPDDVVLAVDVRAANEWPQLVRGVCDRPAASVRLRPDETPAPAIGRIAARIRAAGGRPVLLAGGAEGVAAIAAAGARPEQVVALDTTEDARPLTRRPDRTAPLDVDVWLGRPGG